MDVEEVRCYTLSPPEHVDMSPARIRFDEFELDCERYELLRSGRNVKLEKLPMELLILLVEKSDRLVTRQEIVDRLWRSDVFVDTEHGINTAVRKIRNVLRDDPEQPRFIQTVTGKGYRFVAAISPVKSNNSNNSVPMSPASVMAEPSQTHPRERVNTTSAQAEKRRLTFTAVILLLAGIGGVTALTVNFSRVRTGWFSHEVHHSIRSIAVLPLENLSGDPSQDYFADGMTDELITMLAKNTNLRVSSRTSVMQYRKAQRPLKDIARELGVDGILEGSVERVGDHVHLNAQLIYAPEDRHVWADSFDRSLNEVGTLQTDFAQTVAKQVGLSTAPSAAGLKTISPEAHDAYLLGRYYWFAEDYQNCQKYFREAIRLQPDYAAAWAGLSDYYLASAATGELRTKDVSVETEEAVRKAVALDDSLADAHRSMAAFYFFFRWDPNRALQESMRSLELEPNSGEGHHLRSYILMALNRTEEALAEQKQATELDPFARPWAMSYAFMSARQFENALQDARLRSEVYPNDASLHAQLMDIYHYLGRDRESIEEWKIVFGLQGRGDVASQLQQVFERGGMHAAYDWKLERLSKAAAKRRVSPLELANAYAMLGNKNETIRYLEQCYQEHEAWLVTLQSNPNFDFLHSDRRYQKIVSQMGLPPAYN